MKVLVAREFSGGVMTAYYNEHDPFAAEWLRRLIDAGHIAPGVVDERSIEDVRPVELMEYTQCHFFAGIGVWSYALRLAGWPDDRPVWTGSCPCQPFSSAGQGKGFDDERHLWPAFHHLISQCRPVTIFGEQVGGKSGRIWLDLVSTDLEASGYAFGAVDFPSCGIGAPHIRNRLWWVADANSAGSQPGSETTETARYRDPAVAESCTDRHGRPGPTNGYWRDVDWLWCRDGKWRPVRPGTSPLVDGAPARVGRLRGYGNAINAQVAKEVIMAVMAE